MVGGICGVSRSGFGRTNTVNKQKKNVNIYYLYYVNTIEETIDSRLRAKSALSGEVITISNDEIPFDQYINSLSKTPLKK